MLTVNGDFEEVKKQIKTANQTLTKELREVKKAEKEDVKANGRSTKFQTKIEKLEFLIKFYSVSKMLPVRIEGIIINYKLYSDFMKKVKDLHTDTVVNPNEVVVQYWKLNRIRETKGELTLHDISPYFKDFNNIPSTEINDGQEA
jgi:hypothetical protein